MRRLVCTCEGVLLQARGIARKDSTSAGFGCITTQEDADETGGFEFCHRMSMSISIASARCPLDMTVPRTTGT